MEGSWMWLNGLAISNNRTQFPWTAGQPDNEGRFGNQDCLALNYRGGFDDGYCGNKKRYICEQACPSGSVLVGDQCLVFHLDRLTWNAAKQACATNNTKLASLTDLDATLDYTNATYGDVMFWVGGTDAAEEGSWMWLNGLAISKIPWAAGQPDNEGRFGNQDCLALNYRGGFDDGYCGNKKPYICEQARGCMEGSTWTAADGCNCCECIGGTAVCTLNACSHIAEPCTEGSTWIADGCNRCECMGGNAFCTQKACPPNDEPCTDGSGWIADDGCNQCTCDYGVASCTIKACPPIAESCTEGSISIAGDGCNHCTCIKGEVACTIMACPPNAEQCTVGSEWFADDGCNRCNCIGGNVACTLMACPPIAEPCDEGSEWLADDGCNRCTCIKGVAACTLMNCPRVGQSTSASTQEWAKTFVSYLKEHQYNSVGLKTNNLQNIYNMLFSYDNRFVHMGDAPAFNEILEYMKENGLITVGENEFVTIF
ncbi:unnamed protein product [Meganyctiphanes norvegica]|uniref:C-type lectin domain-containing protein n=1 Tax=Meganyctiphanes norvegica TaxID=48144 RepID=A0AAV2QUZ8_MEGNR